MLRCGLSLEGNLLALAAASHSGEEFHVDGRQGDSRRCRAERGRPAVPAGPAARRRGQGGLAARGRRSRPDPHELLGQARGDACHLCRGRLADRDLSRPRPSAAGADQAGGRTPGRRAGRRHRRRRVRCAAVLDLGDRSRPGVPCARAGRAWFARAACRRRDAGKPRLDVGHHAGRGGHGGGGARPADQGRRRGSLRVRARRRPGRCGEVRRRRPACRSRYRRRAARRTRRATRLAWTSPPSPGSPARRSPAAASPLATSARCCPSRPAGTTLTLALPRAA